MSEWYELLALALGVLCISIGAGIGFGSLLRRSNFDAQDRARLPDRDPLAEYRREADTRVERAMMREMARREDAA